MDREGDHQPLLTSSASGQTEAAAAAAAAAAGDGVGDESRESRTEEKTQSKAGGRAAGEATAPLRYAAPLGGVRGALLRSLPVVFVLSLLSVVVGVYVSFHIAPLLQQYAADRAAFNRGIWEFVVFVFLLFLFMLSFALSVFADFFELFSLMLGSSLDILLFAVIFLFGLFHLYLLAKGMTTIEFCEKRFKRTHDQPPADMWNLGFWRNFNEVFGYNPLLWFLPIDNRRGDGQHFLLSVPAPGRGRE
ncbi:zinc finger DHHC domain-containing protein, putative [Eimeria mitis]|uniref:Zinc finger DHHC domain-containing protein, putative n=1 Tax=Eimeria mitis TaxID=44415 RepID=U6KD30_9EIME|nr:zinc finger DHHC domain-containing protein, putative [Eimeria mitis]CDJ34162.1 zinc finger DHHC domain-containing protein, putative [Eimeria mitis]